MQQRENQKRSNAEVPGPRMRVNSNQSTTIIPRGSSIKITQYFVSQGAHSLSSPARASSSTTITPIISAGVISIMKPTDHREVSNTSKLKSAKFNKDVRSATDDPSRPRDRIKQPFKLIMVVRPKKHYHDKAKAENLPSSWINSNTDPVKKDFRIEPEQRRPLSLVHNSVTCKNVIKDSKVFSRPMIQYDDQGNESSKNETTGFEMINEQDLAMLMENPNTLGSLRPTNSKAEESNVISNHLENRSSYNVFTEVPSRIAIIRESECEEPAVFIEKSKEPSTRDDPSGSSLGIRTEVNAAITEPLVTSTELFEPFHRILGCSFHFRYTTEVIERPSKTHSKVVGHPLRGSRAPFNSGVRSTLSTMKISNLLKMKF